MEKKVINIRGDIIKKAISSLAPIARNALNEEDRLINFMCYNEVTILTATDSARECQIELETNSNVQEVFSLNVNKLQAVLTDQGAMRFEIHEGYVLVHKDNSVTQLVKYKVNHKPFETNFVKDIVSIEHLIQVLKIYSKYTTLANDDTSVVIFSDNLAYVKSQLFYAITEFPLKDFYLFDKVTCNNIISIFTQFRGKELRLAKVADNATVLITCDNISIRVPMLRHDKIDLSKFMKVDAKNGFAVDRQKLVNILKEISLVEGTSEVDLLATENQLVVRPSSEFSLTEYKIQATSVSHEKGASKDFTYTVNHNAFELLLKGVNTKTTMLVSTDKNMLMLLNKDLDVLVRYFISVF